MARTPSVSDEVILKTARSVLRDKGPNRFTITEVAAKVGLSRAAIILRFKNTEHLKHIVLEQVALDFKKALSTLPSERSGDSLIAIAAFIGTHMGSRSGSAAYFADYTARVNESSKVKESKEDALGMDRVRGHLLRDAILMVMPDSKLDRTSTAEIFSAHLTGSIFAWLSSDHEDSRNYLIERTKEWLRLVDIPFSDTDT